MSKQIYESSYGASRKITAADRLAEIACARMASKQGQGLRQRFWEDAAWLKVFRLQQNHANALLKVYQPAAIFKAFESQKWITSLGFERLRPYIDVEQRKLDAAVDRVEEAPVEVAPAASPPRPAAVSSSKSIRNKLKSKP